MIQIQFDPDTLTPKRRAFLVNLINGWPEQMGGEATPPAPGATIAPADRPDAGLPSAHDAFGGAGAHPLASGATVAPSPAAVAPLATAPTPPAASPIPPAPPVPAPSAPTSAPVASPVAPPSGNLAGDDEPGAPVVGWKPTDRDARGFAWDESVHSSSHALVADGTWRKKKGVPQASVDFVENEQRKNGRWTDPTKGTAPAPTAPPTPAPVPQPPAPPVTPAPPATAPTAAPEAPSGNPAMAVIALSSKAIADGKITRDEAMGIAEAHGVAGGLPGLIAKPEFAAAVMATLQTLIASRG